MRAARLLEDTDVLTIEEVPDPVSKGNSVVIRVAGAGVCRSDVHVLDGAFSELVRRPVTPGHEFSGVVEMVGPEVRDLEIGTPVAVMVGWGCGHCEWCVSGHEQLCSSGDEAGATVDGGFAEKVLVPNRRHVIPLDNIDPLDAAPFGCAALCSYAALRRVSSFLSGPSTLVIIGAGGLGLFGTHYARHLTGANILVVDPRQEAREASLQAGAHQAVDPGDIDDALAEVSNGRGASAVIDFVGSDTTLSAAARSIAPRGMVALLGLAGGGLRLGFDTLAPEAVITTVVAGTVRDLQHVVRLADKFPYSIPRKLYALDDINRAITDLRTGLVAGRAVVLPNGAPK